MSEANPGFSDIDAHDAGAEVMRFSLELAGNAAELRTSYQDNIDLLGVPSKQALEDLAGTMTEKLWTLGLDLNDATDQRIMAFQKGVSLIKSAPEEDFGPKRKPHVTNHPELVLLSSYSRLMSGLDMRSNERLQLVPQVALAPRQLLGEIATSALAFTQDDAYTDRGASYPRKAARRVTDVESPYWGYGIYTDDYPGRRFTGDGRGPNISIWMPTGALTDASVLALDQFGYLGNETWKDTADSGYVPDRMVAQSTQLGRLSYGRDLVDSVDGKVAAFLRAAETL